MQGATIRNEGNGALIIGRILKGGLIERVGVLHEGDELLEVNNMDMRGRTVNDAYDIIVRWPIYFNTHVVIHRIYVPINYLYLRSRRVDVIVSPRMYIRRPICAAHSSSS